MKSQRFTVFAQFHWKWTK